MGRLVHVTGSHNSRINKLINRICGYQKLCIIEFHFDQIPGHNVGHIHLKYIGSVLLQEGSTFTRLFGLIICLSCLFPFTNLGNDDSLSNGHFHSVNGGPGGCGENIDSLQRSLSIVLVDLSHLDICNDP